MSNEPEGFAGTKGEWTVDYCEDYVDGTNMPVLDADGFVIADVEAYPILNRWPEKFPNMEHWARGVDDGSTQRERSQEELRANATLFAASKDLLAALQGLIAWKDAVAVTGPELGGILRAFYEAEAAAAKALKVKP